MSGTIVPDDMNREFRGTQLYRTIDRMVMTDPVVRAALMMVMLPIAEATWTVEPATTDPTDLEAAELVRRNLTEHLDWPRVVWQALPVRYGHAVLEQVYEAVEWGLSVPDEDGVEQELPARPYWVVAGLQPRRGVTITRWHVDDAGRLEAVTQRRRDPRTGEVTEVLIPADQLVVTVNEQDGDDYLGVSVCRAMYRAWYAKERLEVIDAMAKERAGVGIPVGWVPDADWEADAPEMQKILAGLRAGEETHLVLRRGDEGQPSQDVQMLDMKAAGQADCIPSLQYHTAQILWAVLGQWQALGQAQTGARATAEAQDDTFFLALNAIAGNVAAAFNRQLVPRLVAYNFPGVDRMPRMVVSDIAPVDQAAFAAAVGQAVAQGALTHDDALEASLRAALGLPERILDDEDDTPDPDPEPEAEPVEDPAGEVADEDPVDEATSRDVDQVAATHAHGHAHGHALAAGGGWWRQPTPLEEHVLLEQIDATVEEQRQRVQALCETAALRVADQVGGQVANLPADGDIERPTELQDQLADDIASALAEAAEFGRFTIRAELAGQQRRRPRTMAEQPPTDRDGLDRWLRRRALASARSIVGRLVGEGERMLTRTGPTPDRGLVTARLAAAARAGLRAEAVATVSQALSAGRRAETTEAVEAGRVAYAVYSAILDRGTCGPCMTLDGNRYDPASEEFDRDYPPLYACEGGERCRCMMVLVAADEIESEA